MTTRSASQHSTKFPAATVSGVLLALAAAALMTAAEFVFTFFGFCEDACDTTRTFSGAAGSALVFLVPAVGLMIAAVHMFMRRTSPTSHHVRAVLVAVLASAGYLAALRLIAVDLGLFVNYDSDGPIILGLIVLVPLWLGATIGFAHYAAGVAEDPQM